MSFNSPAGKTGSRIASSHVTSGNQPSKNVSKIHSRSDGVKTKTQSTNHRPARSSSVSGNHRVQLRPRKKGHVWAKMADQSTSLSTKNTQQPGATVNRPLVRVSRTQFFLFRGRKTQKFCQKVQWTWAKESHHCNLLMTKVSLSRVNRMKMSVIYYLRINRKTWAIMLCVKKMKYILAIICMTNKHLSTTARQKSLLKYIHILLIIYLI